MSRLDERPKFVIARGRGSKVDIFAARKVQHHASIDLSAPKPLCPTDFPGMSLLKDPHTDLIRRWKETLATAHLFNVFDFVLSKDSTWLTSCLRFVIYFHNLDTHLIFESSCDVRR